MRNFVIVLLKELLQGNLDERAQRRYAAALNAVCGVHREVSAQTLDERLNGIMQQLDDGNMSQGFRFIFAVPDTWQYLRDDTRVRVQNYVVEMPDSEVGPHLLKALGLDALRSLAVRRLARLDQYQLDELIRSGQDSYGATLANRAVELYVQSANYNEANFRGIHLIIPLARFLEAHHIERIIKAAAENNQVAGSFEKPGVLRAIRNAECIPKERFNQLCQDHDVKLESDEDEIPF